MTDDAIYQIQEKLNNRPRKRLNWLTPNEAYAMMSDPDFTITKLF
jgi:IS30 family transposase